MTSYAEASAMVFTNGTVPDGYFGDRSYVGFCLIDKQIYTVADCGYFRTGLPDCTDEAEARWLLAHHPSARHIKLINESAFPFNMDTMLPEWGQG